MSDTFHTTYDEFLSLTNLSGGWARSSEKELKASLKRVKSFLHLLRDPQKKLTFVHVTGTSGKGSVCAMIQQILVANGEEAGAYLSPHTTSFLERFILGDGLMKSEDLEIAMKEVMRAYAVYLETSSPLTYFELCACLAMYAFARLNKKWCVLEVGCGGRYDATNVIPTPAVAIITNINKDHAEILGDSLALIAYEKAGIMKKKGTVLCGETRPSLKKIFTQEAIKENSALFFVPPSDESLVDSALGPAQHHNASIALRAAKELGIDETIAKTALKNYRPLPCRFETIQSAPQVILDGAHSPAKMIATAERAKQLGKKVHVIFGCKANKDVAEMLKILLPIATSVTTTRFTHTFGVAANPNALQKLIPQKRRAGSFLFPAEALQNAFRRAKTGDLILVTGSLHLAGEIRQIWIPEAHILKNASSFMKNTVNFTR